MSHLSGEKRGACFFHCRREQRHFEEIVLNIKKKKKALHTKKSTTSFIRGNQHMEQKGNMK